MNMHSNDITAVSRVAEELAFETHDGQEIFYRHWPSAGKASPKGAIVLFHRGHEHGARIAHLVDELDMPGYAFYAWDARGNGRSPGERGDAPDFATIVRDVDTFVRHITTQDKIATENIAVVAQSVGAVAVSAWVHDYAPKIRAQVLASPAFSVKLYVPFARAGLSLMHKLRGNFFVNSYVKARFLTHDAERIRSFENDPLIARPISVRVLLGLYEAADRVVQDARAVHVPTQLLVSGADWVVRHAPQHEFFVNLGAEKKERHVLPGFFHDTLGEKDRAGVVGEVRRFLTECFAKPVSRPSLLNAHKTGYTRDEAEALATPLSPYSLKGMYWNMTRASLKLGGLLSDGIALGHETGFDSGSTLDYVYRNEAHGRNAIGRMMDRNYIDAIGWRGIRRRKVHAEELISEAMSLLKKARKPVRVVDIACGHGRYVLEALSDAKVTPSSILLRDYSDINVAAGRKLIAEKGLEKIARFEKGDAFDGDDLAALDPAPTLGIVSGLYELFPDNDMVRGSLAGLAKAIPTGGYLVYTGQPWHPQLEFIARALTSHRAGAAWIMRRRTQEEMDQLVADAGFVKCEQRIDPWGIFTVCLARRKAD